MTRRIPPVRRLLMDAKALIARPEHWCKEADAKNAKGEWVGATYPSACRFCADGALQRVAGSVEEPLSSARRLMRASIGRDTAICLFNDARETTHPMIMRLYNKAIRRAKEQGI